MTAQGGLVANRGRRFKWAIELSGPGGGSSAAGTSPWVPSNRFP
ncbi:EMC4 isoform 9 [Pan troglodytes]|uniref:ER membrane protein complex subunit 4 n=3 Tax=Hominidae TaxID=9604 RepID=H0YN63_HUMAN|nr:EMC4 isoform 9 [Pan troglodytes]PNJ08387.1 EMC4 isoform 9 [Pongo abelii]